MTAIRPFFRKYGVLLLVAVMAVIAGMALKDPVLKWSRWLTDREAVNTYIRSWGSAAPLIFIAMQALQVIFAPVPGELSGFVGGYVFGATKGFVYSSIGLAMGSAVNFWVGRLLGYRYVRKIIPPEKLARFDRFVTHQGMIVLLGMFLFPGFPKDYLCLFLGTAALPFRLFLLMAAFGRMPGTLMLSVQGEFLFAGKYGPLAGVALISLAVVLIAVKYRRVLYQWAEANHKR